MRARTTIVMTAVLLVGSSLAPARSAGDALAAQDPAVAGRWSKPFAEVAKLAKRPPQTTKEAKLVPTAVSTVVLPDGRILYWGGLEGLDEKSAGPVAIDGGRTGKRSRSRILDLSGGRPSWSVPTPETGGSHDMFCADQRVLPDGRVIVAGGTIWKSDPVDLEPVTGKDGPGGTTELFGSNSTRFFDPSTDKWVVNRNWMHYPRWYPTLVTLSDGRLFAASGVERLVYNTKGLNVHQTEIFDPDKSRWKENGPSGETSLPLFARLHLLPDGRVFYAGAGQMWSPAGEAVDEAVWNFHKIYDPKSNSWADTGLGAFGARSGAFSVMLPLKPPYKDTSILIGGGTLGTSPGSYLANNLSEMVTVSGDSSSSTRTASMNNLRWYSSGVLLPDGNVVAVSGGDRDEVIWPGSESPVRQAELFDGESWLPLASARRDRTYHNTAVLLADGSILVGGHSPISAGYGPAPDPANDDSGFFANNLKDPSFEIFDPPYLFRGPRPRIDWVQRGIAWGKRGRGFTDFRVATPDAGAVKKVVLMRLPSVTHVHDADMRAIELSFEQRGDELSVTPPPNGNVAPPGYYYLFLLANNGQGLTPSKARIVRLGATADLSGSAPAPMGR